MQSGGEPPTPFMLAYRAIEANDRERLVELLRQLFPDLAVQRGTNGNDLLGMAGDLAIVSLLLERGADPNRGNDYGWTKLHQAGYGNDCELARLMLDAGARTDLFARGDGGTALVQALFWGHREVAELLGREPANLRVAAGVGDLELIRQLVGTPEAGAHRGFYRPHGGLPHLGAFQPSSGGARRSARVGGQVRSGGSDTAPGRARRSSRRRSVPGNGAYLGLRSTAALAQSAPLCS